MREAQIERYLVAKVQGMGGECYKWSSPSHRGVPDRIVLLPPGRLVFVELKAAGRKLNPLQQAMHIRLIELGFDVRTIDALYQIDALLESFC